MLFGWVCGQVCWEGPCTEYVSFNHVTRPQVSGPERCCECRRWCSYCGRLEAQYAIILEMASQVYCQFSIMLACKCIHGFHAINWNNSTQHLLVLMMWRQSFDAYLILTYIFIHKWHFPCVYIWSLQWRHNDHNCVSNHQPYDCLLNRLFRCRWKETSNLLVTGLCAGIHQWLLHSLQQGPVTRKTFPFDDVIMCFACISEKTRVYWLCAMILFFAKLCQHIKVICKWWYKSSYRHAWWSYVLSHN